jgi:O-acetyl-ADP-ribose deacetylase (regulator of RNase III)
VAAFVHRLLEKDRARRPRTPEAVAALDRLAETLSEELNRAAPIARAPAREAIDAYGATMAPAAAAPAAPATPAAPVAPAAPLKSPPPAVEEEERMARLHLRLKARKINLVKLAVDAIVNPSNTGLSGEGGLDGAIHRAAGPQLQFECRLLRPCPTGKAKISKGHALPAKHVIHTVGPMWSGGGRGEAELLASCYRECLKLAASQQLKTVAFPAISCGTYLYPLEQAVAIAVRECADFIEANAYPETITFACIDDRMFAAYKSEIKSRARSAYLLGVKKLLRI